MKLNNRLNHINSEIEQLTNQIEELTSFIQNHEYLEIVSDRQSKELLELKKQKYQLTKIYEKDNQDVKDLEVNFLKKTFYKISGKYEEILLKEKQEALAAKQNYQLKCEQTDQLEKDLKEIDTKIRLFKVNEEKYNDLIKKREELINEKNNLLDILQNDDQYIKLDTITLDRELYTKRQRLTSLKETYTLGEEIQTSLEFIKQHLEKGKQLYEFLNFSDIIQWQNISLAEEKIKSIRHLLKKYSQQLKSIQYHDDFDPDFDLEFHINDTIRYFDYLFDSVIANVMILNKKINETLKELAFIYKYTVTLNQKMEKETQNIQSDIEELERKLLTRLKYQ